MTSAHFPCCDGIGRVHTAARRARRGAGGSGGRERFGRTTPVQLRLKTLTGLPSGPPGGPAVPAPCGPCHTDKKDDQGSSGRLLGAGSTGHAVPLPLEHSLPSVSKSNVRAPKSQVGGGRDGTFAEWLTSVLVRDAPHRLPPRSPSTASAASSG